MLRLTATRLPAAFGGLTRRTLATGPASGGSVSDEMIEKLGSLSTQALIDGLWVMGWPGAHIEGARSLAPGQSPDRFDPLHSQLGLLAGLALQPGR